MTDRITQLPAPPEARDDPAHTIEALNDQLQDQAIELDMLREALGVPYEPHQSLLERMLEAARGRAGSGAAPEPPAQPDVPMRDLLAEAREQVEALDRENHKMRRCVARLMARLTVWLDDDQFNEADEIMSPEFEPPAQQPMPKEQVYAIAEEVWDKYGIPAWQTLRIIRETELYHGIGKGESNA